MNLVLALLSGKLGGLAAPRALWAYGSLKNPPVDAGPVPELLTIAEAARLLKISVSGMRRLQQQRRIAFFKVGGSIRFAKRDVAIFLDQNRIAPPAS